MSDGKIYNYEMAKEEIIDDKVADFLSSTVTLTNVFHGADGPLGDGLHSPQLCGRQCHCR